MKITNEKIMYPLTLDYDRTKIIGYVVLIDKKVKTYIEKRLSFHPLILGFAGVVKNKKLNLKEFSILKLGKETE